MTAKILRYIGLVEEASFAVDPEPAAAFHVDAASGNLDTPSDSQIMYESSLSRGSNLHRPGFYSPKGDFGYAFDIQTIGWLIKWALGGYVFTLDDVDPDLFNTHEIYGTEDVLLPSFCARLGKDVFEHVFSGCVLNSLKIEVSDGLAVVTADVVSARDSHAVLQEVVDLELPAGYPLAFHEVTATKDGGPFSPKVKSFTLTIENNLDAASGRGIGNRHPYRIPANARNVTLDLDLYYADTDELELFWGGATGPSSVGPAEFAWAFLFNAGGDGTMAISIPRMVYESVAQPFSGRGEITQKVKAKGFLSEITLKDAVTVVSSELLATINNTKPAMVLV